VKGSVSSNVDARLQPRSFINPPLAVVDKAAKGSKIFNTRLEPRANPA